MQKLKSSTKQVVIDMDSELLSLLSRVKELSGNPALTPKEIFKVSLQEFVKTREMKAAELKRAESKPDSDKFHGHWKH